MNDLTNRSWPADPDRSHARPVPTPPDLPWAGSSFPNCAGPDPADGRGSFLSDLLFLVRFAFGMRSTYAGL